MIPEWVLLPGWRSSCMHEELWSLVWICMCTCWLLWTAAWRHDIRRSCCHSCELHYSIPYAVLSWRIAEGPVCSCAYGCRLACYWCTAVSFVKWMVEGRWSCKWLLIFTILFIYCWYLGFCVAVRLIMFVVHGTWGWDLTNLHSSETHIC